jgi:hypothetical protein
MPHAGSARPCSGSRTNALGSAITARGTLGRPTTFILPSDPTDIRARSLRALRHTTSVSTLGYLSKTVPSGPFWTGCCSQARTVNRIAAPSNGRSSSEPDELVNGAEPAGVTDASRAALAGLTGAGAAHARGGAADSLRVAKRAATLQLVSPSEALPWIAESFNRLDGGQSEPLEWKAEGTHLTAQIPVWGHHSRTGYSLRRSIELFTECTAFKKADAACQDSRARTCPETCPVAI